MLVAIFFPICLKLFFKSVKLSLRNNLRIHRKIIVPGFIFKLVEFDHVKIRIIQFLMTARDNLFLQKRAFGLLKLFTKKILQLRTDLKTVYFIKSSRTDFTRADRKKNSPTRTEFISVISPPHLFTNTATEKHSL